MKLWDAKGGKCVGTLHDHKNQVTCLRWNVNGNWFVTGCKDQTLKVHDVRTMREIECFKGHTRDVTSVAWHPQHETLLASGGYDGSINYWIVGSGSEDAAATIKGGHEAAVWSLNWHPAGHVLCSGSNDNTTKFWCRNRPGEVPRDTTTRQGAAAMGDVTTSSAGGGLGGGGYRPVGARDRTGGAIPGMGPGAGAPPPPAPPPGLPRNVPPPAAPPPGLPPGVTRTVPPPPPGRPTGAGAPPPPAPPPGAPSGQQLPPPPGLAARPAKRGRGAPLPPGLG